MKKFIRKNILRSCSVAMAACLIAGVAFAATGKEDLSSGSASTAAPSGLTDVTGKYDTSALRQEYLNQDVVSANPVDKNQEYWFIVDLGGESLMESFNRTDKYPTFAAYLNSQEGRTRQSELAYAQRKVLSALDRKGISYEKKYAYTELMSGLALRLKLKDVAAVKKVGGVAGVYVSESYAVPAVAVSNNANVYSTGIYNTEEAPNHGAGSVIAVLDTGLDYTHAAFGTMPAGTLGLNSNDVAAKLPTLESYKRMSSLTLSDVYYNDKIPYAYDYADDDTNVYPSYSTHGTHVAGIIAGKDDATTVNEEGDTFVGVSPDAQLVICKVFTDDLEAKAIGGANSVDILAALTDCVKLGVDVINMSLGTSAGFSDETGVESGGYLISEVYKSIENAGISLVVAASNDYSSGFGGAYGTNLTSNPDSGTIGSPSTYPYSLSVASINGVPANYFIANKKEGVSEDEQDVVFLTEANDANGKKYDFLDKLYLSAGVTTTDAQGNTVPDKTKDLTLKYVVVGGVGRTSNYTNSVKNALKDGRTIALVKRGDINFAEKVQNAMANGAIGCIIYNNVSGTIRMSLGEVNDPIPTCSVSMDAGNLLLNGVTGNTGTVTFNYGYAAGPFMSDFSSWGPTPSLELKPEITAHGGEITSSVPGGYETLSGTSMAAPNMSGAIAILRNYVHETYPELTGKALTNRVYQLLMSTATMARNEENNPYSPRKQGAGLAGINEAIKTQAYLTTDDEKGNEQDKPKIELGDDKKKTGVYEIPFDIHNISSRVKTYRPDVYVMTESLSTDLKTVAEKAYMLDNCKIEITAGGNAVTEGGAISVPAGGEVHVVVKITLDAGAREYLDKTFANGMFLEGYVRLIDNDADGVELGIPYLGFYGDWNQAPLFDWSVYEVAESEADRTVEEEDKKKASASSSRPLGLYNDGDFIIGLGAYLYDFGPTDKEIVASDERAAVSCYDMDGRRTVYEFYMIYAGLLRGAKTLNVTIADSATGEVVYNVVEKNVRKSYAAGGSNIGSALSFNINPSEWGMANNKQYTVTLRGTLDYGDGVALNNDSFSFNFTVDTESPVITDYRIRYEEYQENDETKYRIYLDTDVYDNHYAMAMLPCYLNPGADGQDALTLLTDNPVPIYSTKGGTTTVSLEITDYYDIFIKGAQEKRLFISVQDYALNESLYQVNYLEATDYPESVTIKTDDKLKEADASNEGFVIYNLSLTQYERYKLNISTFPDSTAAVALEMTDYDPNILSCNEGEIYAVAESGTYTVNLRDGNDRVKARIRVTITRGNLQKPIIEDIMFDPVSDSGLAVVPLNGSNLTLSLNPNTTTQLTPHVLPWYTQALYTPEYEWSSTNERVLTVDGQGKVTTLRTGTAYVRVSVKGTPTTKTIRVTVEKELDVRNNILMHYYGGEEYVIPDNLNIISIYEEAFQYNTTLRKLTLPISITQIPEECFKGCINLREIVIPANCSLIMKDAFKDCVSLETVTLLYDEDKFTKEDMTGVLSVARSAFEGCTSLKTIYNPERITSAFARAFAGCTALEEINIRGMRIAGESVFEGCTSLKKVTMSSLTDAANAMFRGCTALNEVEYMANKVAPYMFYGCTALDSITFPAEVLSEIGEYAFYNTGFTSFTLPGGTYGIGAKAFGGCANLTQVNLNANANISTNGAAPFAGSDKFVAFAQTAENSTHKVRDGILYNSDFSKLLIVPAGKTFTGDTYVLGNEVTEIAAGAFSGSKIKTIDLNRVSVLGAYAFSESALTTVDVSKIEILPEGVFYGCRALRATSANPAVITTDSAGNSAIKEIGAYAFANCSMLRQRFILPSAVKIGAHAFEETPVQYIAGNEIEEIGEYAFAGTNLQSSANNGVIAFPAARKIGAYAFSQVGTGFTEVVFGAVEEMGAYAFSGNYLQKVTFGEGTKEIGDFAFVHVGSLGLINQNNYLTEVVVPSSVERIGIYAFYNMPKLKDVSLDLSNVKTVGGYAFYNDANIRSLDLTSAEIIEPYALAYTGLTDATLTNTKVIGNFAFANVPLENLSIPAAERIYGYAFYNTRLVTVEIPATLNTLTFEEEWILINDFGDPDSREGMMMPSLGGGAFTSIPTLESITVAEGNPVYFAEDGVLYARTERGQFILKQYPANKSATEYRVKDGTVRIDEAAFYNVNRTKTRDYLAKVTFPSTVKSIGAAAFFVATSSKTSMVSEYVFEGVEAPVLETFVDTQVANYNGLGYLYGDRNNAYVQGIYYSNFVQYVKFFDNNPSYDWLTIHRPANGRGYDSYIWKLYFKNAVMTDLAMDDASLAFTGMVNSLKTVETLTSELAAAANKLEFLREYSEQSVQPVRAAYNAITLADQRSLLQDVYKKLLAVEAFLREERGKLGDTVAIVGINVTSPTKIVYYVGEEFDDTGITVEAVYADKSVVPLEKSDYTISGYNSPLTLTDNQVVITYGSFTAPVGFSVIERPVVIPPEEIPPEEEPKKGCRSQQAGISVAAAVAVLGAAVCATVAWKRREER